MTEIYLIRHAQAEGNRFRIMQGHWDGGVTELGRQQIALLSDRLRDLRFDAVCSSDLYRAMLTASAVYRPRSLPLFTTPALRELNIGPWEQLFFGNLLKESGVTKRLANTASNSLIDIVTTLIGLTVGASTQADKFLSGKSLMIFGLGLLSFVIATASGVLFVKIMNLFIKNPEKKINPLIGNAGVSAVPDSARVSEVAGRESDPSNHLLMNAMAPNVAGVIGSAVAAGILLGFLG